MYCCCLETCFLGGEAAISCLRARDPPPRSRFERSETNCSGVMIAVDPGTAYELK